MREVTFREKFPSGDMHSIYNGIDALVTEEIYEQQRKAFANVYGNDFRLEKHLMNLNSVALEMMLHGFACDLRRKTETIENLQQEINATLRELAEICENLGIPAFNPMSPDQVLTTLRALNVSEEKFKKKQKGEVKISTDRGVLEKLATDPDIGFIVDLILKVRDYVKFQSFLRMEQSDGRIYTTLSVAATETGRWASKASPMGFGTNFQNIPNSARNIFIADHGYKIGQMDQEQAESRMVGIFSARDAGCWKYLDACESGDLHTTVTKLCWPDLGWVGDPKADRAIAEKLAFRELSYRDLSKRLGHGSNYGGLEATFARILKIPVEQVRRFMAIYFSRFPGIKIWQNRVCERIASEGKIVNLIGRQRIFLGNPKNANTQREAIAHEPQGSIAETVSVGILRLRRDFPEIKLQIQAHDAVVFQYPATEEFELTKLPAIKQAFTARILVKGREVKIPVDLSVGWNWGKESPQNPFGMVKLKDGQADRRSAPQCG